MARPSLIVLPGCHAPGDDRAQVEEVSAAASDKKVAAKENSDPLEQFCEGDPSADECRVYGEQDSRDPLGRRAQAARKAQILAICARACLLLMHACGQCAPCASRRTQTSKRAPPRAAVVWGTRRARSVLPPADIGSQPAF